MKPTFHLPAAPDEGVTLCAVALLCAAVIAPASAIAVVMVFYAAFAMSRLGVMALPMADAQVAGATAVVVFTGIVSAAFIAMHAWWPTLHAELVPAWPLLAACGVLLAPRLRMVHGRAVASAGWVLLSCSLLAGIVMSFTAGNAFAEWTHLVAPWVREGMAIRERATPGIIVPAAYITLGLVLALRKRCTRDEGR